MGGYLKKDHKEIGHECMEWIYLVQVKSQWWAVVAKVMNISVP
jgi:hypothetical protein